MRPGMWNPPAEPSPPEQAVIKAVRRAKLFVFLREHRHELFDEEFQAARGQAYADSPKRRRGWRWRRSCRRTPECPTMR